MSTRARNKFPFATNPVFYVFLVYGISLGPKFGVCSWSKANGLKFILKALRIFCIGSQVLVAIVYATMIAYWSDAYGPTDRLFDAIGAFIVIVFAIVSNVMFFCKTHQVSLLIQHAKSVISTRALDAHALRAVYARNCRIIYLAWAIALCNRTLNNVVPVFANSQLKLIRDSLQYSNFGIFNYNAQCPNTCVIISYVISAVYAVQVYMFSIGTLCLFGVVCILVDVGFCGLQHDLEQCRLQGWTSENFTRCRRLHCELCSLVRQVESVFAPIVIFLCACYLPTACIWLRAISVANVNGIMGMVPLVFRSMGMHIVFILLGTYGSRINSKVEMTVPMVDIGHFKPTVAQQTRTLVEINSLLYSSKLSCDPPVLSGYGFLPISKGLMASVMTTVLTYTLVLYKVKPL